MVDPAIQGIRRFLRGRSDVRLAVVFGSRARATARPGALATWRARALADLETDRPWFARMRDAWLARVASRGA